MVYKEGKIESTPAEKLEISPQEIEQDLEVIKSIGNGKRVSALVCAVPEVESCLQKQNLDIKNAEGLTPPSFIAAEKGRAGDILNENLPGLKIPSRMRKELAVLVEQVKDFTILEATDFARITKDIKTKSKGERAAASMLEGLFYGYEPCCIEYYLKTRYFSGKKYRKFDMWGGNVVCRDCMKKNEAEWTKRHP